MCWYRFYLIFEALAYKAKVAVLILPSKFYHHSYLTKNFFKRDGKFWLNKFNLNKIENILNYMYTTKYNEWRIQNSSNVNLVPFDKNNSKLKNKLEELI